MLYLFIELCIYFPMIMQWSLTTLFSSRPKRFTSRVSMDGIDSETPTTSNRIRQWIVPVTDPYIASLDYWSMLILNNYLHVRCQNDDLFIYDYRKECNI
jgi:hypothetical protein